MDLDNLFLYVRQVSYFKSFMSFKSFLMDMNKVDYDHFQGEAISPQGRLYKSANRDVMQ